jgi:hypothetical protein
MRIAGEYAKRLSDAGERIVLTCAGNLDILDFTYLDTWYPETDGSWPDPHRLSVETVAELADRVEPGARVAGELDAEARTMLTSAALDVLPPEACLRRAGWLAALGLARSRGLPDGGDDVAELSPIYLGGDGA